MEKEKKKKIRVNSLRIFADVTPPFWQEWSVPQRALAIAFLATQELVDEVRVGHERVRVLLLGLSTDLTVKQIEEHVARITDATARFLIERSSGNYELVCRPFDIPRDPR